METEIYCGFAGCDLLFVVCDFLVYVFCVQRRCFKICVKIVKFPLFPPTFYYIFPMVFQTYYQELP